MDNKKYEEIRGEICRRVKGLGYECAGFELVDENGMNILRVYLEMSDGVGTEDCENVSRGLNDYLDSVADDLPDRYFLEISSPGLERPLFTADDFRRFEEHEAQISLKKERKKLVGKLVGVDDENNVLILTGDGVCKIAVSAIKRANLVYTPEHGEKKTFKKIPKKKKK
ncbi:MAG: ribosome maturation factor RimP [Synergistes sp.]|nr:ribosome maturation factor RimP [Synergistes sp.]